MRELAELRAELSREGLLEPDAARILGELAVDLAVLSAGVALAIGSDRLLFQAFGSALAGLGTVGVATNSHTASHGATSRRRWVNLLLTSVGWGLVCGVSASWWHHKHIDRHHPRPNVVGWDEDIDLMPWFALTTEERARGSRLIRLYHRHQSLVLPLALLVNGFSFQGQGWVYLIRTCFTRGVDVRGALDLASLGLHCVVWLILPSLWCSPAAVALFYTGRTAVGGLVMFVLLAPGHFPADARLLSGAQPISFALAQTATTVNFRAPTWARVLCAGLDSQIEHHLFPDVSHTRYPAIRARVEQFCRAHGYPYRSLGWAEAVRKSVAAFVRPRDVVAPAALEALRHRWPAEKARADL